VFAWLRVDPRGESRPVLVVANATPTPEYNYRLGVPIAGRWDELINTDASQFGGSGLGNFGGVDTTPFDSHDHRQSVVLTIPPLAVIALAPR
jgi:1,4-alpha-glucan branching enzyme